MLIQSDYHIHASFYRVKRPGAAEGPTAVEQQKAARDAGNIHVGILEHCNNSSAHPFHCLEELADEFYTPEFDRRNTYLGVEADLNDDGSDACGEDGRRKLQLDYVIGSVHLNPKMIPDVNDYIKVEYNRIKNTILHNRNVDIIGHPFGEGYRYADANIVERWGFHLIPQEFLAEIIDLAGKNRVALELNRCDMDDEVYIKFLHDIRDRGVLFSIGSDAHFPEGCPDAALRTRWAESLGLEEKNHWQPRYVIN